MSLAQLVDSSVWVMNQDPKNTFLMKAKSKSSVEVAA